MRLAVLSDMHGNLVALERVTKHLAGQGANLIVNLGDCIDDVLEYDWAPVIERARSLGFGAWADAFEKE